MRNANYEPEHWALRQYDSVRERSGISREEAVERAWAIRERLEPVIGKALVMINGLDNPFMSEDARLCILNEVLRRKSGQVQFTREQRYARMRQAA
jgi:hypothetical protein